jgi:hypothetical protein
LLRDGYAVDPQGPVTVWPLGPDPDGDAVAVVNDYPQYSTLIDGQKIHFLHVRSPDPTALPIDPRGGRASSRRHAAHHELRL